MMTVLLCGLPAKAADSVTLEWDIPGSVIITKSNAYSNFVTIPEGATSYTVSESGFFYVRAAEGYELTASTIGTLTDLYGAGGYSEPLGKGLRFGITMSQFKNKTVKLTVVKLAETPFSLEVANGAASITFQYYKGQSTFVKSITGITDGNNALEYPSSANTLYIKQNAMKKLYKVSVNGTEIEPSTVRNEYFVTLSENCKVYVAADDPATAQNVDVTFKFANNNPNIVSNIRDWANNKFIYPAEFGVAGYKLTLPKGSDIQFNWNEEASISSLTANGTAVTISGNTRVTVNENTEYVITGKMIEYPERTVQVYAVGYENLNFSANGAPLQLTYVKDVPAGTMCGTTEIPTDAKLYEGKVVAKPNAGISFEPNAGYYVKKALRGTLAGAYAEPQDRNMSGVTKIDLANCPLYIEARKINYTDTLHVYYQGVTGGDAMLQSQFDGANVPFLGSTHLESGWNTIIFDPAYNTNFIARINIASDGSVNDMVKTVALNGTAIKANDDDQYVFAVPANNSVLKMFFTAVAPVPYYVTFQKTGYAPAKVTYDMGSVLPDFDASTRFTAYGPTPVVITPGANVTVKQDGTTLTATNGVINVTLNKKATFTFEMNAANEGNIGQLDMLSGSVTRNLNKVGLSFPFDGEHSLDFNMNAVQAITLTPKAAASKMARAAADNAIHALSIEPGEPSETTIPVVITFPETTEAGEYTLDIPAGVFYQTAWDDATEAFTFQTGCKVNAAMTADYTVDPNKPYEFTFTPANGSKDNEINEAGTIITISVPDAETVVAPTTTALGPWIVYGDNSLKKVDDAAEETGWSWMESANRNEVRILLSANAVKYAGTLTITADAGAFTIDGTASPAISYSAQFGEEKEFEVTCTPKNGTDIEKFDVITLTYVGATSIEFGEYFEMMLAKGLSEGTAISKSDVTLNGNVVTIKVPEEAAAAFKPGLYSLSMDEGSLIIDGKYPSTPIHVGWNLIRTSEISQDWTPNPTGAIVNYGYGVEGGIAFGELETVGRGTNYNQIEVYYDDVKLSPYVDGTENIGYLIQTGGSDYPNVFMISVYYTPTDKSGKMKVVIPAGALTISGTALANPIEYTWDVVMYRDYAYVLTPTSGSSVAELAKVQITFPEATTATISESFVNGWAQLKQSYMVLSNAKEVKAVEGAAHPTFEVTFATPAADKGNYSINIWAGAFILDSAIESPQITGTYTVDPSLVGISGIYAEDGLYTVVNMQGIMLMRDADVEKVKALPAGLYIINGQKVNIRK